jgi:two-component system response regulator PrrA
MTETKARILIAEDAEDSRRPLLLMLKLAGFACLEADNGRAAIELVLREKPDLVLMDLSLPEVDGLQAVRELRAAGANLPIIVVSGYDDQATRDQAQQAGANGYVTKPIDFEELKKLITEQLRPR